MAVSTAASVNVDIELRTLNARELRQEKGSIASQLLHVQQQISDLAYGNYRIYADAGSTTDRCRKMYGKASDLMDTIGKFIDDVRNKMHMFTDKSASISKDLHCIKLAESKGSPMWDILSLPARMDLCIRAGYYDIAYTMTNYGTQLLSHGLAKNSVMKAIADKLIVARYRLLDELFNRFSGPVDLAASIQVVNNIRKIPLLTPTQLRIAVLQYRDVYLEKQLMDNRSQPDFISRMVEIYRDFMYDTMVLYLSVFPEGEIAKHDLAGDSRWDVWDSAGSTVVLSEWAVYNIDTMFNHIRNAETKKSVDVGSLESKLMSFAMSFGRMGMDFRPLIASFFDDILAKRFSVKVHEAAARLTQNKSITIDGEIPDPSLLFANQDDKQPAAPSSLALWDDLCVYGNDILDAMNELRSGLSPMQIGVVLKELTSSLRSVFAWLDENCERQDAFKKAVKLLVKFFVPYLNRCLLVLFPYEKCCRLYYHTSFTLEQYERRCAIKVQDLHTSCSRTDIIAEIVNEYETNKAEHVIGAEASTKSVENGDLDFVAQPQTNDESVDNGLTNQPHLEEESKGSNTAESSAGLSLSEGTGENQMSTVQDDEIYNGVNIPDKNK